jgi:hypothetical protein
VHGFLHTIVSFLGANLKGETDGTRSPAVCCQRERREGGISAWFPTLFFLSLALCREGTGMPTEGR